ncbi:hypothetical protein ALMP_69050 [Streptomyces sp. A012304]|nr:hypothetical protein ALMP_69050 [Streptomyces sp. A012304]
MTHNGETLHTEAGSREGEDSIARVRSPEQKHAPGTIVIRIPLPNARNAQLAQRAMGFQLGPAPPTCHLPSPEAVAVSAAERLGDEAA